MTDMRSIGYAGVELHLGGPHTPPSVSPSDHAREAALAIFGDWEDEVPEATKHIQKAIDAAVRDALTALDKGTT